MSLVLYLFGTPPLPLKKGMSRSIKTVGLRMIDLLGSRLTNA